MGKMKLVLGEALHPHSDHLPPSFLSYLLYYSGPASWAEFNTRDAGCCVQADHRGAGLCFRASSATENRDVPASTLPREQMGTLFPTADRLTQMLRDWNVHWGHLRKNPLKIPALQWFISWNFHVNHSSAPGWSFLLCVCVCVCFNLVQHLLLMGLAQLSAGS